MKCPTPSSNESNSTKRNDMFEKDKKIHDVIYAVYFENSQYRVKLYGLYAPDEYELEKDRIADIAARNGLKATSFLYKRFTAFEELN